MSASATQRRERILMSILQNGEVSVKALAASLGTSEPTIRRDLRALAASNQVKLFHGGAVLASEKDPSFRSRARLNAEAKSVIGRLAAGLVSDGDTILLDSGSTCAHILPYLRDKHNVTIITHSARLALDVDIPSFSVILIGGHYRPHRMDTVGPLACADLDRLRGYTAFIGADGLDMEFGLAATEAESAHVNGLAARNAARTVLVVDRTKFTQMSVFKVAGFEDVSDVVTDAPPSSDWVDFFTARGIRVITPEASR